MQVLGKERTPARHGIPHGAPSQIAFEALIAALHDPATYPHPVQRVDMIETHISCVLLTGEYVYKIKKPVRLGFLDFSSLDARRSYCNEELRLNRRTAPGLYLDVVPISGSPTAPVLHGGGAAIEYAVRMRQFPQDALLDHMARAGTLASEHVDALAQSLAVFHSSVGRSGLSTSFGSPSRVLTKAAANFNEMRELAISATHLPLQGELRDWMLREHASLAQVLAARQQDGLVRECHGDLHLGNIALIDGVPTPFDCIEFNADFRWIDVIDEIAFPVMDLLDHQLPELAFRFLNAYLEITGDYGGVRVLRFYLVYRALVRAKVAGIRAQQTDQPVEERTRSEQSLQRYLKLARRLAGWWRPALIIMHGLSGSGKTTVSQRLLESLATIRLRSDVERKRLHGFRPEVQTRSGVEQGIYSFDASAKTYDDLAVKARTLLDAGYPVIVDAAFLQHEQRARFRELAAEIGAPFAIVSCVAAISTHRERIVRRTRDANDASEAGGAVLDSQLATQDSLTQDETAAAVVVNTEQGAWPQVRAVQELMQRLELGAA